MSTTSSANKNTIDMTINMSLIKFYPTVSSHDRAIGAMKIKCCPPVRGKEKSFSENKKKLAREIKITSSSF